MTEQQTTVAAEGNTFGRPPAPALAEQLARRREAAHRLPPLDCGHAAGHRDPLDCLRAESPWLAAVEHREQFRAVVEAARTLLDGEPSTRARRDAAGRLSRAILALADDQEPDQ